MCQLYRGNVLKCMSTTLGPKIKILSVCSECLLSYAVKGTKEAVKQVCVAKRGQTNLAGKTSAF